MHSNQTTGLMRADSAVQLTKPRESASANKNPRDFIIDPTARKQTGRLPRTREDCTRLGREGSPLCLLLCIVRVERVMAVSQAAAPSVCVPARRNGRYIMYICRRMSPIKPLFYFSFLHLCRCDPSNSSPHKQIFFFSLPLGYSPL